MYRQEGEITVDEHGADSLTWKNYSCHHSGAPQGSVFEPHFFSCVAHGIFF